MKPPRALALSLPLLVIVAANAQVSQPARTSPVPPEAVVYDAVSAMAFLRTLNSDIVVAGDDHASHERAATARSSGSFKTKGSGSIVVLTTRSGKTDESESVSVFHMDGQDLFLTHYCGLYRNAPLMKFEKTARPGEIRFAFAGGTNFDQRVQAHMHDGVFRVIDSKTVEETYTVYTNGNETFQGRAVFSLRPPR
jgi:hypothetical protein